MNHTLSTEETTEQPEDESGSSAPTCYADVARHLHDEAAKIEAEALPMMKDGFLHDGYRKLDLSSSLRTAANYLDGVSAA
jgi:hypothetical protein